VKVGDPLDILSVNVGLPREVPWRGKTVLTGIFKEPVAGRIPLRTLNLDGDRQADLVVHGGPSKAVYAYPAEHYEFWRQELPDMDLPWGTFGENLTTQGLREDEVYIGDRFRVGSAELMVTEPRMPCYKLGIKFGTPQIIRRFLASRRSGFYFSVILEGEVGTGDEIHAIARDPERVTVTDIVELYVGEREDLDLLRRAERLDALPENWRTAFRQRIEEA
jgi:MOSC domain-containing protein YiiM